MQATQAPHVHVLHTPAPSGEQPLLGHPRSTHPPSWADPVSASAQLCLCEHLATSTSPPGCRGQQRGPRESRRAGWRGAAGHPSLSHARPVRDIRATRVGGVLQHPAWPRMVRARHAPHLCEGWGASGQLGTLHIQPFGLAQEAPAGSPGPSRGSRATSLVGPRVLGPWPKHAWRRAPLPFILGLGRPFSRVSAVGQGCWDGGVGRGHLSPEPPFGIPGGPLGPPHTLCSPGPWLPLLDATESGRM